MKILALLLILLTASCSQLPSKRTDKLSILQGITNTKEVEFSVVSIKGVDLRFELRSAEGEIIAPAESKVISKSFSQYVAHKIIFIRDPNTEYNLYAYQGDKIIDQRLVGKGQKSDSKLRLALVSGMSDFHNKHFGIWNTLASKNPEYLLMAGDTIYTDASSSSGTLITNPEIIWQRYVDARLSYPLYFLQKLIPTHAIWDDRDYGESKSGLNFKYKEDAKEAFDAFYAQDLSDDDWSKGLGVGGVLSLGDFNLYFLDGRSFRSQDKNASHLGLNQTAWLYSKLKEEMTPSFLIKGDPFFGGHHNGGSFEGDHPDEFVEFVGQLRLINTPFIFLSGDRKMSEIMQFPRGLFGKPSFEMTSGPLHDQTSYNEEKNPWRVVSQKDSINFTLIDNTARDNHWFLDVESIGKDGELYYKRELAVYIKDLQNNLEEARKRRSGKRRYRKIRSSRGRR